MPKTIEKGTAILIDFDKKMYTKKPAATQNIAVLVPEANIPQKTKMPVVIKKIRSNLILDVIPNNIKATVVAAALHP